MYDYSEEFLREFITRGEKVTDKLLREDMLQALKKKHPVSFLDHPVKKGSKETVKVAYMKFGDYEFAIGIDQSAIDFQYSRLSDSYWARNAGEGALKT